MRAGFLYAAYIKWIMGTKPFLILELDSHTADAGVDTRIEAFWTSSKATAPNSRTSGRNATTTVCASSTPAAKDIHIPQHANR